ncbi:MAG: CAP domain-containing protein [Chloroflexota bacterium]|nr:MAG: hypothetical protein DIU80_03870 [Chloroflexota bacterium]
MTIRHTLIRSLAALLLCSNLALLGGVLAADGELLPAAYLPLVSNGKEPTARQPTPTTRPTTVPTVQPTQPPLGGVCFDGVTVNAAACEDEIIRLVNLERQRAGCPPAVRDERLMIGARNWSRYMLEHGIYEHSPLGWYERPENGGYPNGAGENIAGSGLPEDIVVGWMSSSAHRNLILSCYRSDPSDPINYNPHATYEIGVGYVPNGFVTLALDPLGS